MGKICSYMSRPIQENLNKTGTFFKVMCQKEKCGSWGKISLHLGYQENGDIITTSIVGCKRDEKGN